MWTPQTSKLCLILSWGGGRDTHPTHRILGCYCQGPSEINPEKAEISNVLAFQMELNIPV